MKILFVIPYAPTRIRVRSFEWLRHLTALGHQVTLVAPWTSEREEAALAEWRGRGVRVVSHRLRLTRSLLNCLAALPTRRPLQAVFCWQPALARAAVGELAEDQPDVIHVEHLRGSRYAWMLGRIADEANVPIVWDSVDCISALFQQVRQHAGAGKGQLFSQLDLQRTREWEAAAVRRFARTLVVAPRDREALVGLAGGEAAAGRQVDVLTMGVDLERFRPRKEPCEPETVIFSGKMSYHANLTAVRFLRGEVMPRVWRSRPNARLCLAGAFPPRELLRISDDRVEVTGFIEDLGARLARATVAVAPMVYGTGVQLKVLEALACETPCVVTPSAVLGLETRLEQEVLVAEDADGLAAGITRLLGESETRRRLATAGRRYVESNHSWERLTERLLAVYGEEQTRRKPESS